MSSKRCCRTWTMTQRSWSRDSVGQNVSAAARLVWQMLVWQGRSSYTSTSTAFRQARKGIILEGHIDWVSLLFWGGVPFFVSKMKSKCVQIKKLKCMWTASQTVVYSTPAVKQLWTTLTWTTQRHGRMNKLKLTSTIQVVRYLIEQMNKHMYASFTYSKNTAVTEGPSDWLWQWQRP